MSLDIVLVSKEKFFAFFKKFKNIQERGRNFWTFISKYTKGKTFFTQNFRKKDDVFDFLMEVAYARRTNQFFDYNLYHHEKRSW